jgi:hypothetical protein
MPLVVTAEAIERRGRGTTPPGGVGEVPVADWGQVAEVLGSGEAGPFWLSVSRGEDPPHVRPLFAAWGGESFYLASKSSAAKTAHLRRHPNASISIALDDLHVVVEGRATRVTDTDALAVASTAMLEVFGWPTRVAGDELDADYGAPTSGGPPYQVFELVPVTGYAFPLRDQVHPTRWTFLRR